MISDSPVNGESALITYYQIATHEDWWAWISGPLAMGARSEWDLFLADSEESQLLWWTDGWTLKGREGGGFVNSHARLLGGVRLSQWRTASDSCHAAPPLQTLFQEWQRTFLKNGYLYRE